MPIVVSTKDCTALSDAELAEMADLCADRPPGFDIGFLSKEREDWVLVTQAREGNKLRGYSFCTLERIGGTPSLLVGLAAGRPHVAGRGGPQGRSWPTSTAGPCWPSPTRTSCSGPACLTPEGFRAFTGLHDVVPCPRPQVLGRGAGLGAAPGEALRLREPARRPDLRPEGRRLGGRRPRLRRPQGQDPRRRRGALRRASTPTGATAWSPSAGRWPRTWPGASSAAEPGACGRRRQPRGRTAAHTL